MYNYKLDDAKTCFEIIGQDCTGEGKSAIISP
jgi:hypothetical protein